MLPSSWQEDIQPPSPFVFRLSSFVMTVCSCYGTVA